MKKLLMIIITLSLLAVPVSAAEFTAPQISNPYMPAEVEDFSDGLWFIIKNAIHNLSPEIRDASGICLSIIAVAMLISLITSAFSFNNQIAATVGIISVAVLLFKPSDTFIQMGINTVQDLSQYGKLLLPVMTASLAAAGGATTSATLYAGTAIFNHVLTTLLTKLIVPLIYIYLCVSVGQSIVKEDLLGNIKKFVKWVIQWGLKVAIYIFTGYLSITGVISGTVDASALKATKLAISGFVPVVGGVISDASETILLSAGLMKNAAGIYGGLAILAMWIGPFLQIGFQYLLLKVTGIICSTFHSDAVAEVIKDFTSALGFVLGMIVTICVLLLISTVCFMKGVS